MSFSRKVRRFHVDSMEKADRVYRATAVEIFNSVIRDTPVDTGRARGNWQATTESPAQGQTSRAGAAAAQGEVIQKVGGLETTTYLTNNLPYIQRLEYGYSKQAPQGMVRRNVARLQQIISRLVRTTR